MENMLSEPEYEMVYDAVEAGRTAFIASLEAQGFDISECVDILDSYHRMVENFLSDMRGE